MFVPTDLVIVFIPLAGLFVLFLAWFSWGPAKR